MTDQSDQPLGVPPVESEADLRRAFPGADRPGVLSESLPDSQSPRRFASDGLGIPPIPYPPLINSVDEYLQPQSPPNPTTAYAPNPPEDYPVGEYPLPPYLPQPQRAQSYPPPQRLQPPPQRLQPPPQRLQPQPSSYLSESQPYPQLPPYPPYPPQSYPPYPPYPPQPLQPQPYLTPYPVYWPPFYPLAPNHPKLKEPLPTDEREYHEFFRTTSYQVWKPLLAIFTGGVGFLSATIVLVVPFIIVMIAIYGSGTSYGIDDLMGTPAFFLITNLSLAALIPICMGIAWMIFSQRPKWLSSIVGKFRLKVFVRSLLVALPIMAVLLLIEWLIHPDDFSELKVNDNTLAVIAIIVCTTVFQCAGEEYLARGLLNRCVGSMFSQRRVGLVVGAIVSSVVFASLHGSTDIWRNLDYLAFGIIGCILVWKTGGLEAPIALHAANNLIAESILPFSNLGEFFQPDSTPGSPEVLIQVALTIAAAFGILWQARRLSLPKATAPGADQQIIAERRTAVLAISPVVTEKNEEQPQ